MYECNNVKKKKVKEKDKVLCGGLASNANPKKPVKQFKKKKR